MGRTDQLRALVRSVACTFRRVLSSVLTDPRHRCPHADTDRVSEAGRRVRRRGGSPRRMSGLLQDLITDRALARPEAPAVLSEGAPLTYGELDAGSDRLARMLWDLGCRRGDRVALLMPKMPAAIMSLLGVLKADAVYVPLDPTGAAPRLARMLEVCGCHCILAAGPTAPLLGEALARATLVRRPLLGWLDTQAPWGADPPAPFTRAAVHRRRAQARA